MERNIRPGTAGLGLAVLAASLISGCAALKGNVTVSEPDEGPKSRIRVVFFESDANYIGVRAYPNSDCWSRDVAGRGMVVNMQTVLGFEKSLNGRSLGMPETVFSRSSRIRWAEFYAAANRPITFSYYENNDKTLSTGRGLPSAAGMVFSSCSDAVYFSPAPDTDYELVFSGKNCEKLWLFRLSPPGDAESDPVRLPLGEAGKCGDND